MPGLVNAHCHLDYTDMAGQFPPPKVFTDWLKLITATKAGWSYSDFAAVLAARRADARPHRHDDVADIEAVPELLPEVWEATPLRVFSFLEMIGIKPHRQPSAHLAGSGGSDRIAQGLRAAARVSRPTRPTPPCRNCCA